MSECERVAVYLLLCESPIRPCGVLLSQPVSRRCRRTKLRRSTLANWVTRCSARTKLRIDVMAIEGRACRQAQQTEVR